MRSNQESTNTAVDARDLPDHVDVGTGGKGNWRISQGKVQRGRKGQEEVKEVGLLGYLRRIGVHYGETEDGRAYGKLECDLETKTGLERVGTYVLNPENGKPTLGSSTSFAEGLLQCKAGDLVQVSASLSKNINKYGSHTTYARVTLIDPETLEPVPGQKREKSDDYGPDYLDGLLDQLKEHPAYAERPARDWDDDQDNKAAKGTWAAVDAACAAKGWPGPSQAPDAWLAAIGNGATSLGGVSDEDWASAKNRIEAAKKPPKFIADAMAAADEFDPFA